MAMLQRSHVFRSCQCNIQSSSVRTVVRVGGLSHLRRSNVPVPIQSSQNQLAPANPKPLGYGQLLSSAKAQQLRQKTVMQSFLGVGAPEAILVAVVALVVFGPKGLADAAKGLGQTLRAFQPTIREVVEVSQEIKGTLEQELGLDEIRQAATMRPTPRPIRTDSTSSTDDAAAAAASNSSSSSSPALQPMTEDQAKTIDPEIELKRAMSEQAAWGGQTPVASTATVAAAGAAAATAASSGSSEQRPVAAGATKELSQLSLEELEAELARRKKAQA